MRPASLKPARLHNPGSIVVLHHLLLGDSLMLTPLLAKLRTLWPAADITFASPRALLPLYADKPFGIRALAFDPRDPKSIEGLRRSKGYDLALIPAENRYSPLAKALGARWIVGFAADRPAWKNWLLNDARAYPTQPATYGDFAARLVDGPAPAPYTVEDWPLPTASAFDKPAGDYAVLHLGASSRLKQWPAERWQTLANWLYARGITPTWSAGAKEIDLVKTADPDSRFRSFAGQLDLVQLAHLLAGARLLVCPDTGVAHLGRITGTPTVALFGPGTELICGAGDYWRNSPFLPLSIPIACRNQTLTFRRHADWIQRCGRSFGAAPDQCADPRCMTGISLEAVLQACEAMLQRPPNSPRRDD